MIFQELTNELCGCDCVCTKACYNYEPCSFSFISCNQLQQIANTLKQAIAPSSCSQLLLLALAPSSCSQLLLLALAPSPCSWLLLLALVPSFCSWLLLLALAPNSSSELLLSSPALISCSELQPQLASFNLQLQAVLCVCFVIK